MIEPLLFYKLMGKLTKWFLNSFGSHYDGADKNNSMSHDPVTFFLAISLMVQSLGSIQTQKSAPRFVKALCLPLSPTTSNIGGKRVFGWLLFTSKFGNFSHFKAEIQS